MYITRLPTVYRIAGNFQGRKLSRIGENTIFADITFADCSLCSQNTFQNNLESLHMAVMYTMIVATLPGETGVGYPGELGSSDDEISHLGIAHSLSRRRQVAHFDSPVWNENNQVKRLLSSGTSARNSRGF